LVFHAQAGGHWNTLQRTEPSPVQSFELFPGLLPRAGPKEFIYDVLGVFVTFRKISKDWFNFQNMPKQAQT
jgi:hypothetical protein